MNYRIGLDVEKEKCIQMNRIDGAFVFVEYLYEINKSSVRAYVFVFQYIVQAWALYISANKSSIYSAKW